MDAFDQSLSSIAEPRALSGGVAQRSTMRRRAGFLQLAVALAVLTSVSACTEKLPGFEGTTSLRVELVSPADVGTPDMRLPDTARTVVLRISAIDAQGIVDPSLNATVKIFAHYLGSLTPEFDAFDPLDTAVLTNGVSGEVAVELPSVFGPSFLWVEDSAGDDPTYATGTSPTMWYRDPYLADVSRPVDEAALDAFEASPLENKQAVIHESRYGARGRMVVTGSFAQGYTVSDVQCADENGSPPCVTGDYDHIFVFTFSRPEAESSITDGPVAIKAGHRVDQVSGGISEFNGLTEVGFPSTVVNAAEPDPAQIPAPVVIQPEWLTTKIEMERAESGLVAIENATMCPLDDDFASYFQWKLDLGMGCNRPVNIITAGQVPDFTPEGYAGKVFPLVVGTLRPVNIGSFHVWIVYPRTSADITPPVN